MNPQAVFLHNDLVAEVLSALPVKSLVRFKCVSNHWKTLISDHAFVKLHLRRSQTRNQYLTLVTSPVKDALDRCVVPYPIRCLLDNPSFTLFDDPHHRFKYNRCKRIVGSCNGLILFSDKLSTFDFNINCWSRSYWLSVWNPATRETSETFGYIRQLSKYMGQQLFNFAFGYDNSNDTYKVVAFYYLIDEFKTEVRVLSLGDHVWRNVECFMNVILLQNYVDLNETINWLAIHKSKDVMVEFFVIISFDLRSETYKEMDVPCGFNQVSRKQTKPVLGVLGRCLCFSYYYEKDFVIWLMKEFGDANSWTQFLKINNLNLGIDYNYTYRHPWVPLLLSDDILILTSCIECQAILYNWRDNKVTRTSIIANRTNSFLDWKDAKVYVESLVPVF